MPMSIKIFVKKLIARTTKFINSTRTGSYIFDRILAEVMKNTQLVSHRNIEFKFSVPNQLSRYRADSFSTKEPETLNWIDGFPQNSTFWDIGANVGLYTCYAAKTRNCKVFAFEPSVFNLELLARNVSLNALAQNVAIVPLPLSNAMCFSMLKMTNTEWGGALSTFGQNYGWDGREIHHVFEFQTLGISADDAQNLLNIPSPNYIKIDVDGIEHLVLSGAKNILAKVDGVLIEVNDGFEEQADRCNRLLIEAGLVLREKKHSDMFNSTESFGGGKVWNQIWIRT